MLIDKFNRVHDYLRISLTDNCNLRGFYGMPEENYFAHNCPLITSRAYNVSGCQYLEVVILSTTTPRLLVL